jgi:predicted MFS family arabinose efflux permease
MTNLPPVPLWVVILATTSLMVATSARMVPAMALVTASAAPRVRGGFLSLNAAVQSAAMALASEIGGRLIGQTDDGRLAGFPVVGLIAAGSALVSLLLAGVLRSGETGVVHVPAKEAVAVVEAAA